MRFIATIACITVIDCLTSMFGFLDNWFPELPGGEASLEWKIAIGAVAVGVLSYQLVKFAMWLASLLLYFPSIAEGVVLQAWDYAQARPKNSHMRLELEKAILRVGRKKLGLKRVRTARGVVNKVLGVEPTKREKIPAPVYDRPRVVVNNEWKEAA